MRFQIKDWFPSIDKKPWVFTFLSFFVVLFVVDPAVAAANAEVSDAPLSIPFWTLLAGSLSPLVGYVLNYQAPWINEKFKAIVQVAVAAVAGALFQLITSGDVGFNNETASYVATTVVTALFAHKLLWQPSTISASLGGGKNRQTD